MNRDEALPYVSFGVDNALTAYGTGHPMFQPVPDPLPAKAVLVGWQCGSETMFVAVWSYLGTQLGPDEATDLAVDMLQEKKWFSDNDSPPDPDYVLLP